MITAEVAVLAPLPGPYTYEVPPALAGGVQTGTRVWVPLQRRRLEGVVLQVGAANGARAGLRPIDRLLDSPPLPEDLLQLGRFIADYYLVPHGEALRVILPGAVEARSTRKSALTERGLHLAEGLGGALLPLEAAELSPGEQAVLSALRLLGGPRLRAISDARLRARLDGLPHGEVERALQRLGQAGWIERHEEVQAGVRVLQESVVAPLLEKKEAALQALGRSPARAALWRQLLENGPTALSALLRDHPRVGAQVKALEQAGLVAVHRREVVRDAAAGRWSEETASAAAPAQALTLTPDQGRALTQLLAALDRAEAGDPGAFLLQGITGSGKTEVYLQLIAAALQRGRTALVLVPEIGLTPQLAARFRARFGPDVAVLHSGLTGGERADSWRRLARGEVRIALGPRSALFAPLSRLGVIIVDEEHDASFKQQEGVRYHGRDVALVRAQHARAVVVLGSATPSLESLAMVEAGRMVRLSLTGRATGSSLPEVQIIDLKQHLLGPEDGLISAPLQRALEDTLKAGEQAILFLNRRGYATFLLCKGCGHRFQCQHCAVTLTWHKGRQDLLCHYCGYIEDLPERCPLCQAQKIDRLGMGTQRIEEEIRRRFPAARVARLDRDTAAGAGLHQVLGAMHRREIDVLIGTQMLAKGHDFPYVTLVGVVLADTGIGLPDFRASERTFQLLTQVAGRAGRAERPGRVIIQTYSPQHPAIQRAVDHDFAGFAQGELLARRELRYPPAARLAAVRLDGVDPLAVREAAQLVARRVREVMERAPADAGVSLLGPAEAPLSRLKGRTRWQMLVRAQNTRALRTLLRAAQAVELPRALHLGVDVDPVSTL